MAVKMKKPDYWPALEEGERLAGIQRERDATSASGAPMSTISRT